MNREIKFRGKIDDFGFNNWIYGFYYEKDINNAMTGITECHGYIIRSREEGYATEVNSNTAGQYTGVHDRFENEIYEGDIVEITRECVYEKGIIVFKNGCFFIKVKENLLALYNCEFNNYKVKKIGNIYDNPEMLGGE